MKYLKKYTLFEGLSDDYSKKISDYVEKMKSDFKVEVDECMYDLIDTFDNTSYVNFHSDDGVLQIQYSIEIKDEDLETFKKECISSFNKLKSKDLYFDIQSVYVWHASASRCPGGRAYISGDSNIEEEVSKIVKEIEYYRPEMLKVYSDPYDYIKIGIEVY